MSKYKYDRTMLSTIDTEEKAYLLGWIASDASVGEERITLLIKQSDVRMIETLKNIVSEELPIINTQNHKLVGFRINSKQMVSDVCKHLKINPGKKSYIVQFPNLGSDELKWSFLRGYFDGDGSVASPYSNARYPKCSLYSSSEQMIEQIVNFTNIPCSIRKDKKLIEWFGINALDFMGKLYNNTCLCLERKYDLYCLWSRWSPSLKSYNSLDYEEYKIKFSKTRDDAVFPYKARISDSGYDLVLLEKVKQHGKVSFYDTGIKVNPPYGIYFDLVARSSITKSGYMIANGLGIIDRGYTGNILVPLMKVDESAKDLELPSRLVQLVPREILHFELLEVSIEDLERSERDSGGFGSSNE